MGKKIVASMIFFTLFSGCYKNHLYVQQEWVDRNFLASSHVGTPDPRQEHPPLGQRLLVAWRFPLNMMDRPLELALTVRFWDNSEQIFRRPIQTSHGSTAFDFFDSQKILTYRIQVVDCEDAVIENWEHHFWTRLIVR